MILPVFTKKKKKKIPWLQRPIVIWYFDHFVVHLVKPCSHYSSIITELQSNKRLQVAYTHAHAYMWAPVPQGSLWLFCILYYVAITYVMRVVAECVVTIQSRCLEPEV